MLQTFKLETEHCEKKMMAYKLRETTLAVRSSLIKLSKTLEPWQVEVYFDSFTGQENV